MKYRKSSKCVLLMCAAYVCCLGSAWADDACDKKGIETMSINGFSHRILQGHCHAFTRQHLPIKINFTMEGDKSKNIGFDHFNITHLVCDFVPGEYREKGGTSFRYRFALYANLYRTVRATFTVIDQLGTRHVETASLDANCNTLTYPLYDQDIPDLIQSAHLDVWVNQLPLNNQAPYTGKKCGQVPGQ